MTTRRSASANATARSRRSASRGGGSSIGSLITTKLIIGVTGILLFAYLILHIAGNVIVFLGPETFNNYSHALISNPLVVPVEIGLVVVFLIHLFKAIRMTFENQSARPANPLRSAMTSTARW